MADPRGFLEHRRQRSPERPTADRVQDWHEVLAPVPEPQARTQASRCMDCGVPFCHPACPVNNRIPDWNDLAWRGCWEQAAESLGATNNFPEVTGLVCPAPCEGACVLGINDEPVTIKQTEFEIARRVLEAGPYRPRLPLRLSGRRVAIVGSGPAGLAAAQQLARAGHQVVVFEQDERAGGLLRFGIPDFKLEKWLLDRRLDQLQAEGVEFRCGVQVGVALPAAELRASFDAVLLATGAGQPRDLDVEGRRLDGVHFAMEYLAQQNRRGAGPLPPGTAEISAAGRHVIVLGGGDTGSDCVGTALRQGALTVTSLEIQERPPDVRLPGNPWPRWPLVFRSSFSHDEGGSRDFGVATTRLSGSGGRVEKLHAVRVRWVEAEPGLPRRPQPIPGSEFERPAGLVLLALGFLHPVHAGLLEQLALAYDARGNVRAAEGDHATSVPGVFAAGDARRGQSLVVWAIHEGRQAAAAVDRYLRRADQPGVEGRSE